MGLNLYLLMTNVAEDNAARADGADGGAAKLLQKNSLNSNDLEDWEQHNAAAISINVLKLWCFEKLLEVQV